MIRRIAIALAVVVAFAAPAGATLPVMHNAGGFRYDVPGNLSIISNCQFQSVLTTVTDGTLLPIQCDANGRILTTLGGSTINFPFSGASDAQATGAGQGIALFGYNGATFDRLRVAPNGTNLGAGAAGTLVVQGSSNGVSLPAVLPALYNGVGGETEAGHSFVGVVGENPLGTLDPLQLDTSDNLFVSLNASNVTLTVKSPTPSHIQSAAGFLTTGCTAGALPCNNDFHLGAGHVLLSLTWISPNGGMASQNLAVGCYNNSAFSGEPIVLGAQFGLQAYQFNLPYGRDVGADVYCRLTGVNGNTSPPTGDTELELDYL